MHAEITDRRRENLLQIKSLGEHHKISYCRHNRIIKIMQAYLLGTSGRNYQAHQKVAYQTATALETTLNCSPWQPLPGSKPFICCGSTHMIKGFSMLKK